MNKITELRALYSQREREFTSAYESTNPPFRYGQSAGNVPITTGPLSDDIETPRFIYLHELHKLDHSKLIPHWIPHQYSIIMLVADIDRKWTVGHIDHHGSNLSGSAFNKYVQSRFDIFSGQPLEIPTFEMETGEFVNGRNRFANIRDMGFRTIPIRIIDQEPEE